MRQTYVDTSARLELKSQNAPSYPMSTRHLMLKATLSAQRGPCGALFIKDELARVLLNDQNESDASHSRDSEKAEQTAQSPPEKAGIATAQNRTLPADSCRFAQKLAERRRISVYIAVGAAPAICEDC